MTFGRPNLLANSRLALEAAECARDAGRFPEFHEGVFRAYFTEGRNIGERGVILEIGRRVGLEVADLEAALDGHSYLPRLAAAGEEARALGIAAAPTFLIGDDHRVVGAQPIEALRASYLAACRERKGGA